MKKTFILAMLMAFCSTILHAQKTDNVNFDTYTSSSNNDLANDFTGGYTLKQVPDHGITGGCVKAVHGSNNATYTLDSFYYRTSKLTTSISFLYVAANNMHNSNYMASVGIHTYDSTGAAQTDLFTYVDWFGGPELAVHLSAETHSTSLFSGGLVDGHWYKLVLETQNIAGYDSIINNMYVYDLGTNGTSSTLTSQLLNKHTHIPNLNGKMICIPFFNGDSTAGSSNLDNFSVSGHTTTGIEITEISQNFSMPSVVTSSLPVSCSLNKEIDYTILSITGATMKKGSFISKTNIDVNNMPSSLYLIRFTCDNQTTTMKFVKQQ